MTRQINTTTQWLLAYWFAFTATAWADVLVPRANSWPNGPFKTSGRWILDASGTNVTYAGVSWPGHGEAMVPEGLQYQSIATIVGKVKSLGMNAIRLTYATEMIDQIFENGGEGKDVSIEAAFVAALGKENGTAVLEKVIKNNPSFSKATTRLQAFDAVAAECAKQEIYIHLDNHLSKAGWCCNPWDGNAWFGDIYYSVANWTRGLGYMAKHGKSWPNLMSMSLRNELRQPLNNMTLYSKTYNWETWYRYTQLGAAAIHDAHSGVLVFLSGLDSDSKLDAVVRGKPLSGATPSSSASPFNATRDFPGYAEKLVLELHTYDNPPNCSAFESSLSANGFSTLSDPGVINKMPLLMTEFGYTQDATTWNTSVYATCLLKYLPAQKAGWTIWVLAGSYYIRSAVQDYDEGWGLLTKDWSAWRSPEHVEGGLKPLVKATLEGVGIKVAGSASAAVGSNNGPPEGKIDSFANGASVGGTGTGTGTENSKAGSGETEKKDSGAMRSCSLAGFSSIFAVGSLGMLFSLLYLVRIF
ncbi:glycoside hydrolase superfamily [Podospora didyma]|uniref:Glycoside hydrolase superfamily n=1 Tax=Podospora didyma TaxID=330526 RepID=A0AAE0NS28_9PEZI|nr:glycoside hydrolase superfamily [Podospora didyma]